MLDDQEACGSKAVGYCYSGDETPQRRPYNIKNVPPMPQEREPRVIFKINF